MRPPTGNAISQTQHGTYKAVDYHSSPDVYIYAPEDGIVFARLLNAGDAGNELQVKGAHGRHGFCHIEEFYVQPGEKVIKGQKLAKMGYTGLTSPVGPAGRHLHWVILQPDGTYVYPPSLITEPFGGSKGDDVSYPTKQEVLDKFQAYLSDVPTDKQIKDYTTSDKSVLLEDILIASKPTADEVTAAFKKANQPLTLKQLDYYMARSAVVLYKDLLTPYRDPTAAERLLSAIVDAVKEADK